MPRIDPLSLLKCLSVLLGPTGGIKSKDEVHRLANLMTKFSKKLVSKCIYIQILKTTNTELLSQFMTAGGWNLVHSWLSDGIVSKNWALLQELLELLLLCPVDIERLKSNNCPKLIKGLSKEAKDLTVRSSAGKLVDQWLKLVKSEVTPHPVTPSIKVNTENETMKNQTITINDNNEQETNVMISKLDDDSDNDDDNNINNDATVEMNDLELKNNCVELVNTNNINDEQDNNNDEEVVEEVEEQQEEEEVEEVEKNLQQYQNADKQINVKPVQFKIINKTLPGQSQPTQISKQSFVVYPAAKNKQPVGPVYKIIIKDGKQLLKKVDTVPKNLKKVYNNDIDIKNDELCDTDVVDNENSFIVDNCEVKKITNINNIKSTTVDNTDNNNSDVNKSNDKENRDSRKKNDDKMTTSSSSSSTAGTAISSDKKHSSQSSSSSKSKHSSSSSSRSSSSSHRSSSHRSSSSKSSSSSSSSKSSRDRDRHHSSSSKHGSSSSSSSSRSKSDKDKDKDKDKKDQAEKDKATLEKIQGQSLSTKFGKIPKKKSDDDKNDTTLRKSSTDSRDSSKENKDNKKISSPSSSSNNTTTTTTTNSNSNSILEKKNISISIENRKNSTDQPRPKTVKTFNSKFRSTGLEEEVKPPPSKSSIKKSNIINDNKKLFQPKLSLKRPSPLRDTPISDKKIKLSLEPPTPTGEEKKGAIKLIAPKPKPMVLQESDMFMDALMTASTKGKEPRKRKRRTSLTKDDKNDIKKSDGTNEQGGKDDESPASPPPSEKSPLPVKPDFKFYQDTLETDEDKEEKEKSQDDDESQDDNDKNRANSDDDDERSRTPTNDDDSSDKKHSPLSPDSEVRYVDGLRSVLVVQKRKGPKKLLKWNTELESIRYFELDETERVNVTKTFTDMKQMEKQGEREAFQMARKLSTEDTMEEKIKWRVLIPLDLPPALVDPGKDSKERDIQYAREKSILQALYFNRGMIPDSPAEPDEERHHVFKDPIIIPLDDLTGNKESEKDFSMLSWPEPKPRISIPPPSIIPQQQIITQNQQLHYQQFTQHNQMLPPNMQNGPMGVGLSQQQIPQNIMSLNTINELNNTNTGIGGGGWRTGDGKVVVPDVNIIGGANNIPGQFVSGLDPLIMAPTMIPPPNLYNQQPPDNFNGFMGNDDNNFGHMQNNFQGPPGVFNNNNNNNNNFRGGSGGNNNNGGGGGNGVMMANRGRGGTIPVWFRGGPPGTGGPGGLPPGGPGGPGPMRGVWNNAGRGNWRNNGKPVCRQFVKNGFCRLGDKCQYFHPGPNCPPF